MFWSRGFVRIPLFFTKMFHNLVHNVLYFNAVISSCKRYTAKYGNGGVCEDVSVFLFVKLLKIFTCFVKFSFFQSFIKYK